MLKGGIKSNKPAPKSKPDSLKPNFVFKPSKTIKPPKINKTFFCSILKICFTFSLAISFAGTPRLKRELTTTSITKARGSTIQTHCTKGMISIPLSLMIPIRIRFGGVPMGVIIPPTLAP